jgi:predicted amidohydrolase YtcJ
VIKKLLSALLAIHRVAYAQAQPEASALAVKAGRIYSVGTDADMLSLRDSNTRVIDAGSRRLIPGIRDAHTHVLNMNGNEVFGTQEYGELTPSLPDILPAWSPVKFYGGYYKAQ